MDALLLRRRTLKGKLTRINTAIESHSSEPIEQRIAIKYKDQLEQLWGSLNEIHEDLGQYCDDDAFAAHQHEFDQLASRIESLQFKLPDTSIPERPEHERSTGVSRTATALAPAQVRLPRLELPTFSGNYHEWSSFYDLFTATIQTNEQLSGGQKLQYLKASLRGEAALLLQSIQVTDNNFEEAWQILNGRYHNRREIINSHLKRLCSQPALTTEAPAALRKLIDTTNETVRALRVLKAPVEHWDIILVHIVSERLDPDSRRFWELSLTTTEVSTYSDFMAFLELRARALITCQPSTRNKGKQPDRKVPATSNYFVDNSKAGCPICKEKHPVFKCSELLQSSIDARRALVRTHGLCYNCLSNAHLWKQCKAGVCRKCSGKHHTLLHAPLPSGSVANNDTPKASASYLGSTERSCDVTAKVLLATALIKVKDNQDANQVCRALLDSGSQATFITEACVQRLGITKQRTSVTVSGLSATTVNISRGSVELQISSYHDPSVKIMVNALVLKKVTGTMPNFHCDVSGWRHLKSLKLADPEYNVPNPVDVLLGADILAEILRSDLRRGAKDTPIAQNSVLGWLVSGRVSSNHRLTRVTSNHAQYELEKSVQRFWELEEVPSVKALSTDEKHCEEHFTSTHQRDIDGRFIVRLPFKTKEVLLDPRESRYAALRRLHQVEKKMERLPLQQKEYRDFLREYENLNHMELMRPDDPRRSSSIYLPHHAVIKEGSTTTRLRVVFDASAKGHNGSLNDHLLVGATLQDDLCTLLIRFRKHAIAFTADIKQMYRQIRIHEEDTQYQNIVWRQNAEHQVQDYRLLTLTYGTASAPFLATRCLQQLAMDEAKEFPKAAEVMQRDFYMDDLMSGADTLTEAITLKEQLIALLRRGGFDLRKWASNSKEVLYSMPIDLQAKEPSFQMNPEETIKTLGLKWNPNSDQFSFSLAPIDNSRTHTKRTVLSTLARIFDPLGWLCPVTITAKIMLQRLWKTSCTWDDALPRELWDEWNRYLQSMNLIESIRIPRRFFNQLSDQQELHGFCDASESAYAATVFLKIQHENDDAEISLIAAKTRVAPLKTTSLPRLELCGALLLARLLHSIQATLRIPTTRVKAWTDSTVTLAWIKADSTRWKTFVANRVSEIQDKVPAQQWFHVKGTENPADCASRGVSPSDLRAHPLWWRGPEWLKHPTNPIDDNLAGGDISTKGDMEHFVKEEKVSLTLSINCPDPMLKNYSSLETLTRVTAYLFRFQHNCSVAKTQRNLGPLSIEELNHALLHWIKTAQREEFSHEVKCLTTNNPLSEGSRLACLNPFIDTNGVIRVGGRLRNAPVSADRKFPILLPRKHDFTTLLVRQEHLRNLHAGPQLLLATLQLRYWILCGRDVVRQYVRQCVTCQRHRVDAPRPLMGDLPAARVTSARPFLHCGVDYAGPFHLRGIKLRGQRVYKAYVAVFICFVTHAMHIELVSDMTTEAFIAALKRFIARRGRCSDIYSDHGSNFIGASKELKSFMHLLRTRDHNDNVARYLSSSGIRWHFIPPSAPHFGGLWEAGVKSVKFHLRRIVGNETLNYEEMSTVLSQIEACLNSRPLCPITTSPDDLAPLTPGHFLIGDTLTALPEPDYTAQKMNRLSRWQLVQRLTQHFWKRWSREFLARLQQRPRAWTKSVAIKVNDLVVIKDDHQPPARWKLGRVLQLHPGKDGIVRVVTLKTDSGQLKRPVVKICRLPVEQ